MVVNNLISQATLTSLVFDRVVIIVEADAKRIAVICFVYYRL